MNIRPVIYPRHPEPRNISSFVKAPSALWCPVRCPYPAAELEQQCLGEGGDLAEYLGAEAFKKEVGFPGIEVTGLAAVQGIVPSPEPGGRGKKSRKVNSC